MREHARRAVWPWALALAWTVATATEPDGALALRAVWEDPDHLQVTLRAVVPLEQIRVTWTGPQGLRLKAEIPEGTPPETIVLAALPAGSMEILHLRLEGTRGEGAARVVVVRVEAVFGGRLVREALGIPVSTSDGARLRGDVLEFPAAVEP